MRGSVTVGLKDLHPIQLHDPRVNVPDLGLVLLDDLRDGHFASLLLQMYPVLCGGFLALTEASVQEEANGLAVLPSQLAFPAAW